MELTRRAAVTSRLAKPTGAVDLRGEWSQWARAAGFDTSDLALGGSRPHLAATVDRDAVIATALARVAEHGSTWIRSDLAVVARRARNDPQTRSFGWWSGPASIR